MNMIGELLGFIFNPQTPIAKIINFMILVIASGVLVRIVYYLYRIKGAFARLRKLESHFEGLETGEKNAAKIEELAEVAEYKHPWFRERLAVINKLKEDPNATIDSIDNLDMDLRWKAYGILRYPNGSLIVLGLFGTVWGLQKAVYSLLPTIGGTLDLEKIKVVMVGTLTGMQTAFATTLAGLICSIFLGFAISLVLKGFLNHYINEQKNFLVASVIPQFSLMGSAHLDNISKIAKSLKSSVTDLAKQSDLLFQPIVESASKINNGIGKIYESSQTFVTASEAIEGFSTNLSGSLTTLTTSLNEVKRAMDTYNKIQTDIEKSLASIAGIPDEFQEFMRTLNEQFNEYQKTLQEAHDNSVQAHQAANEAERRRFADSISGLLEKMSEAVDKVANAQGGMEAAWKNMETHQKRIVADQLKVTEEQHQLMRSSLEEILKKSQDTQDHKSKQLLEAISSWITYNQQLSDHFGNLPKNIADAIQNGKSRTF